MCQIYMNILGQIVKKNMWCYEQPQLMDGCTCTHDTDYNISVFFSKSVDIVILDYPKSLISRIAIFY